MSQEHNPDLNRNHFVWNHSAVRKGEKRKAGRRRLKRNWVGGTQVPARIDALLPSNRLCSIKTRNSGILHQSIVCHNCHQGVTHPTTRVPPSLNNQIKMKRRRTRRKLETRVCRQKCKNRNRLTAGCARKDEVKGLRLVLHTETRQHFPASPSTYCPSVHDSRKAHHVNALLLVEKKKTSKNENNT